MLELTKITMRLTIIFFVTTGVDDGTNDGNGDVSVIEQLFNSRIFVQHEKEQI